VIVDNFNVPGISIDLAKSKCGQHSIRINDQWRLGGSCSYLMRSNRLMPGYSGEASDQLIAEQSLSIAITEALDHKPM